MRRNRYNVQGYRTIPEKYLLGRSIDGWLSYGFRDSLSEAIRLMQGIADGAPFRVWDCLKQEVAFVHGL